MYLSVILNFFFFFFDNLWGPRVRVSMRNEHFTAIVSEEKRNEDLKGKFGLLTNVFQLISNSIEMSFVCRNRKYGEEPRLTYLFKTQISGRGITRLQQAGIFIFQIPFNKKKETRPTSNIINEGPCDMKYVGI